MRAMLHVKHRHPEQPAAEGAGADEELLALLAQGRRRRARRWEPQLAQKVTLAGEGHPQRGKSLWEAWRHLGLESLKRSNG